MIGTTLAHFRITAALGAGGMGEVYKAFDSVLERDVAIKVMHSHLVVDIASDLLDVGQELRLAAATAEVEQEANRVREALRGQVSAIAVASAEKILQREIDPQAHEDILSKLASEL